MDTLWKQHTPHRLDPVKYFPVEIVNLIFSFVVYHVVELESDDPWRDWEVTIASSQIIAGYRDVPLVLASVSRAWCDIVTNSPPLWSTIFIDQSEGECLERIHLFLDRSGKEPLDIILLDPVTPTGYLSDILMEHANRFKSLVGLSAHPSPFGSGLSRIEPLETPAPFVNWSIYSFRIQNISTVPIPRCLHRVQLDRWLFDATSLIQLTYFHNLESLCIAIFLEPKDEEWDKTLRFEHLRHLHILFSNDHQSGGSNLQFSWTQWLECPALMDLSLSYLLDQFPPKEIYSCLEASLLRFKSLRKLRVRVGLARPTDYEFYASEFQDMQPSLFDGSLELVEFLVAGEYNWVSERFFSVFVPSTHLVWQYEYFPSPTIFSNLKSMRIRGDMEGSESALVAPWTTQLVFPFLEELYIQCVAPRFSDLRAPCLKSLHIYGLIPSDLRHISNSTISSICLLFEARQLGSWEVYLPPADKLQLDLETDNIFRLNVHPSQIHAVTINITDFAHEVLCPPYWTVDHISEMLGPVTDLKVESKRSVENKQYTSQTMPSFLKPFAHLTDLTILQPDVGQFTWIDQVAPHLADPNFLPKLEALSISEYPSWPDFFLHIQQRQTGFLSGRFQAGLKKITIQGQVHGALLEHLRESLGGLYTGLVSMPPCRKGSKGWPAQPFDYHEVDTDGVLCCYVCHKACLETGCMISPSQDAKAMLRCDRHTDTLKLEYLNTVFAP